MGDLELVAEGIDNNVVQLASNLVVGDTYFWKVSTEYSEGEIWEFTVGPDFTFDPDNTCDDLDLITAEIDEIRIALNQGSAWQDWCSSDVVREAFEETTYLKSYDLSECTNA